MSRFSWAAIVMILSVSLSAYASDFYEWTDEKGVTHFADSLDQVPAKYRSQLPQRESDPNPGAPAAAAEPAAPAAAPLETGDTSASPRRFEVPYQAYEGSARRVIIPVTFNDALTVPMALDTGSPGMVISFELAERLRVFSRDTGTLLVEAAGIGGSTLGVLTIIDSVSVEGARDAFVPTTVTNSLSPAFQGLIGMDFMSNYTIHIDSQKHVVVFEQNPSVQSFPAGHAEDWWRRMFKDFRAARDLWQEFARTADSKLGRRAKAVADFQAREAERLLLRLDSHASDNAVPRHWR